MTLGSTIPSQFLSDVFRLFDGSDATKKTKFILTGITSGNVRALTVPNQDGTISLEGHSHTESDISDLDHLDEFIELSDTPNEYASADIGKILRVKDDLSGLEFTDSPEFAKLTIGSLSGILKATAGVVADSADISDVSDVDTSGVNLNEVLKFDGTNWVPGTAGDTSEFTFSIASFTDNEAVTQLIGSGVWESVGNIDFGAAYNNGPPDSASIALTSDGGVTWGSSLVLTAPFTAEVSAENTAYPSSKDEYVRFTLTATKDGDPDTVVETVYFRNYIRWGLSTIGSGFAEAHVEALPGSAISNDHTRSEAVNAGVNDYIVFAHPSTYSSIPDSKDYEDDGVSGFLFNGITIAMNAPETVEITNSAGYVENYKVYASTQKNLGNHTLVTSTSGNTLDPILWGVSTKASGYIEADIEGLANSVNSNDNTRAFTVTAGADDYIIFAYPKRLGTVTFWVGGFEGGFQAPETVSVTNANGFTEDYYIYRSDNKNLGETEVTTT